MTFEKLLSEMGFNEIAKALDSQLDLFQSSEGEEISSAEKYLQLITDKGKTTTENRAEIKKDIKHLQNYIDDKKPTYARLKNFDKERIKKFLIDLKSKFISTTPTSKKPSGEIWDWVSFEDNVSRLLGANLSKTSTKIQLNNDKFHKDTLSKLLNIDVSTKKGLGEYNKSIDGLQITDLKLLKDDSITKVDNFEIKKYNPTKLRSNVGIVYAEWMGFEKGTTKETLLSLAPLARVNQVIADIWRKISPEINNSFASLLNKNNHKIVVGTNPQNSIIVPFADLSFYSAISGRGGRGKIGDNEMSRITIFVKLDNQNKYPSVDEYKEMSDLTKKDVETKLLENHEIDNYLGDLLKEITLSTDTPDVLTKVIKKPFNNLFGNKKKKKKRGKKCLN